MLLDEKQLLYEEITELKKDNRKLREKLLNKSQNSSTINSGDKSDYFNKNEHDIKFKDKFELKKNSPNSSTDLFLNTSDLVINKSTDDFLNNNEHKTKNLIEITKNSDKNLLSSEDRVKNEIEELNKLEIDQDMNLNHQFETELQELNLTHLSNIKSDMKTECVRDEKEDKVVSNIKNIV